MSFTKLQFITPVLGIFAVFLFSLVFPSFETINTVSLILLVLSICFVIIWYLLKFWANRTTRIGDKK